MDQRSSRLPNSDHELFWCKFGFKKCFRPSSQSNHWTGHQQLSYKIHFLSHVTIQLRNGSLLCRIREDDTSECIFPICFKCRMAIEWLSSWATSLVVVRGSASMTALNWSLSTSHGQPLCFSSPRLSFPLQNFLNHHCTALLLAVPGPNVFLMLWVVSAALWPILNLSKKIARNRF